MVFIAFTEGDRFKFAALGLAFLYTVFDRDLALAYTLLLFANFLLWRFDKNKLSFPFQRMGRGNILFGVGAGLGVFLAASIWVSSTFGGDAVNLQNVFDLLAANIPGFDITGKAARDLFTFASFAFVVPLIETPLFFGRVQEEAFTRSKTSMAGRKVTFKVVLIWLVTAAIFTAFHLTVKRDLSLWITFVFGVVSAAMVYFQKETMTMMK